MDVYADFAGRLLADRYRLPRPPSESLGAGRRGDLGDVAAVVAFDTASDQEVLVRQIPLPEIVEAEVVDAAVAGGRTSDAHGGGGRSRGPAGGATRRPADPMVRRAVEAAWAAAQLPDHPRLGQVYDVFVEGDGLWVVSELVPARPLSALLAERPLKPYRAAEIAEDLLAALRTVHAHGWTHRNITPGTVLVCDDGRALLTGLATGAAEEALCGYDPIPPRSVPDKGGAVEPDGVRAPRDAEPATAESGVSGMTAPEVGAEPWAPATWTGSALPEGFPARQDAGAESFGRRANERLDGRWEDHRGPGIFGFEETLAEYGPLDTPGAAFGDGSTDERGVPEKEFGPGAPPVRHGYETYDLKAGGQGRGQGGAPREGEGPVHTGSDGEPSGPGHPGCPDDLGDVGAEARLRAARRGAIAAYRASARRAAEMRAADGETARREDEGEDEGEYEDEYEGEDEGEDEEKRRATAANGDWWPAATSRGGGPPYWGQLGQEQPGAFPEAAIPEASPVPDEDVRWLPPSGDVVSSTTLPGARTGGSCPVRTTWEGGAEGAAATEERPTETAPARAHRGAIAEAPATEELDFTGQAGVLEGAAGSSPGEDDGVSRARRGEQAWGGEAAGNGDQHRGPATALAEERARHARMTVIGPVTERWAPEQAGPVHRNYRLAPPVGPAADLWALGALLFRAVQGHAPYPEESAAELVQRVCAEPPAFAEECGPLRPVVESLMRHDPAERPDSEELRGWLRSLVRSAPEPEAGRRTVLAPPSLEPGRPSDPRRLPILRRRGELVRRRRGRFMARGRREARAEESRGAPERRRHKKGRRGRGEEHHRPSPQAAEVQQSIGPEPLTGPAPSMAQQSVPEPGPGPAPERRPGPVRASESDQSRGVQPPPEAQVLAEQQPFTRPEPVKAHRAPRPPRPPRPARPAKSAKPPRSVRTSKTARNPRGFGRWLVGLVLFGMMAGVLYALWFLPQGNAGSGAQGAPQRGSVEAPSPAPSSDQGGGDEGPAREEREKGDTGDVDEGAKGKGSGGAEKAQRTAPAVKVPAGFELSKDPAGFRIAVPEDWNRRATPGDGQVRYNGGQVEMVIVKGRDTTAKYGEDPTAYQADDEPELSAYRASDWATASGLRRIDVGETSMAEGAFGWRDSGRQVYARNRAMVLDGRYHVLLVMGSNGKKQEVDRVFEAVAETYRVTR